MGFFTTGMRSSGTRSYKGGYDNAKKYYVGETVSSSGTIYICLKATIGNLPSDIIYWDVYQAAASGSVTIDDANTNTTSTTLSALAIKNLTDSKINDSDASSTTSSYSASQIETKLNDKSKVVDSATNGNLVIDSSEVTVYDDTTLKNASHTHANKSTLDKLTDNGVNILFNGSPIVGSGGASFESWAISGGEQVILVDITSPLEASNLVVTNVEQTSLSLNWTQSSSIDVKEYSVYEGTTLLATVTRPYSIYQIVNFDIVSLVPNTSHTYTIKTKDNSGNESIGVSITGKTLGNQALYFNGTSEYLKLPSLSFTTLEIKLSLDLPVPLVSNIILVDARNGLSLGYWQKSSSTTIDTLGSGWSSFYVNGVLKTGGTVIVPNKTITTVQLNASVLSTDDINIFSGSTGTTITRGSLYYVKLYSGSNLVAYYDFTAQFSGTSVSDSSGNAAAAATITGGSGTWIVG